MYDIVCLSSLLHMLSSNAYKYYYIVQYLHSLYCLVYLFIILPCVHSYYHIIYIVLCWHLLPNAVHIYCDYKTLMTLSSVFSFFQFYLFYLQTIEYMLILFMIIEVKAFYT